MFYGDEAPPEGMGSWLAHAYRQIVSDRIGGRMLTLVADGEEALIAHIPSGSDASGVRTRNPVLALIAREYLHHDLVLQRAQIAIGFGEWDQLVAGRPGAPRRSSSAAASAAAAPTAEVAADTNDARV